jgi:hypothetical protein
VHRIDTTDHVGNLFSDGDPAIGRKGTVVDAAWLNAVQEELVGILSAASVSPNKADTGQLAALLATKAYVDSRTAIVAKTADQQVTASAVAVSALVVPVLANALYEIEFQLRTSIPNGNQPYIALTGPASPTRLGWSLEYPGTAFAWLAQQDSAYYERQLPVMPNNEQLLRVRLVIDNGANAGNVGLTVRGSTAEYVRRGSFVRYSRLA